MTDLVGDVPTLERAPVGELRDPRDSPQLPGNLNAAVRPRIDLSIEQMTPCVRMLWHDSVYERATFAFEIDGPCRTRVYEQGEYP
jgi:hypothetical protein